jgi:DNA-binding transcriptional regulator YiaG
MRNKNPEQPVVERPYPRRCFVCGNTSVTQSSIPHDAKVRHEGKVHEFHIPTLQIDRCENCSEQYFTAETDDQISLGLRKHLGLLTVAEIRTGIEQCKVSQKVFAEQLGIAAETVSRWVNDGGIQTRSLDKLMRLYFSMPTVRAALSGTSTDSASAGSQVNDADRVRPELRKAMIVSEVVDVQVRFGRNFSDLAFDRRRSFSLVSQN